MDERLGVDRRVFLGAIPALAFVPGAWAAEEPSVLHVDKRGLLVQRDGDGGDTAQREGWAWLGTQLLANLDKPSTLKRTNTFEATMRLLEIEESGRWRRHPDQWSDPSDFSRDQTIPIVAALGMASDRARLDRLWQATKERGYRAQNGDLMGPEHLNLFARARGEAPSDLGDAQLLASVATRIVQASSNMDDVGDDLNLIVMLLVAAVRSPSDLSTRAMTTYAKNRPMSYGCYLGAYREKYGIDRMASPEEVRHRFDDGVRTGWKVDVPRVLGALRWYFRDESGGSPALAELYEPLVRKWLE